MGRSTTLTLILVPTCFGYCATTLDSPAQNTGAASKGVAPVHLDGAAVRSCSVPLSEAAGRQITTIEGLARNGELRKVQKAWLEHQGPQCGYCQCGMIMAVVA